MVVPLGQQGNSELECLVTIIKAELKKRGADSDLGVTVKEENGTGICHITVRYISHDGHAKDVGHDVYTLSRDDAGLAVDVGRRFESRHVPDGEGMLLNYVRCAVVETIYSGELKGRVHIGRKHS